MLASRLTTQSGYARCELPHQRRHASPRLAPAAAHLSSCSQRMADRHGGRLWPKCELVAAETRTGWRLLPCCAAAPPGEGTSEDVLQRHYLEVRGCSSRRKRPDNASAQLLQSQPLAKMLTINATLTCSPLETLHAHRPLTGSCAELQRPQCLFRWECADALHGNCAGSTGGAKSRLSGQRRGSGRRHRRRGTPAQRQQLCRQRQEMLHGLWAQVPHAAVSHSDAVARRPPQPLLRLQSQALLRAPPKKTAVSLNTDLAGTMVADECAGCAVLFGALPKWQCACATQSEMLVVRRWGAASFRSFAY